MSEHEADGAFYDLALHCARAMDARYPGAPAAELLRGRTLHSLHRFKEAETIRITERHHSVCATDGSLAPPVVWPAAHCLGGV